MSDAHEHISTEEILKDIKDTENEIAEYRRKVPALEILGDRMSLFRADYFRSEIKERERFIVKLKEILEQRQLS